MSLKDASLDELRAEMARREAECEAAPKLLAKPEWGPLLELLAKGIERSVTERYEDFEHYVYEAGGDRGRVRQGLLVMAKQAEVVAHTIRLTALERKVLSWLADPPADDSGLNAVVYSEAIVGLLKRGLCKLGGTLSAAHLELTDSGKAAAEALR
jgi:hypothetical protein